MPDFLPAPQLPQGLAESLSRLAMERARAIPDALTSGFSAVNSRFGDALMAKMGEARTNLNPDQVRALLQGLPPQVTTPTPPGQPGAVGPGQVPLERVFPRGVPPTLVEQISRQREQEAIAKQTTERVLGAAGLKAGAEQNKLEVPVSETTRALFAKAKLPLDPNAKTVRHEDYEAAVKAALGGDKGKPTAQQQEKEDEHWEKSWAEMGRYVDPSIAPRGSMFGMASQNNARADRALVTLADKSMTPQQLEAVTTDLSAIMKGGTPDEQQMKGQSYGSLATEFSKIESYLASKPKSVNVPETVAKLKKIVQEIKTIDNKVISQRLKTAEAQYKGVIKRDPTRWKQIRDSVMEGTLAPGESGTPSARHDEMLDKYGVP